MDAYKKLNLPKQFSISYVDEILKGKYKAIEVDISQLDDAYRNNAYVDYHKLVKSYFINDEVILKQLFSDYHIEKRNDDVASGRLIIVVLESEDGEHVSFHQQQGECKELSSELKVYYGIKEEQCVEGNADFELYLNNLISAGFIEL